MQKIDNKNLWYSTENFTLYFVMTYMRKEVDICICTTNFLLKLTWHCKSIILQYKLKIINLKINKSGEGRSQLLNALEKSLMLGKIRAGEEGVRR